MKDNFVTIQNGIKYVRTPIVSSFGEQTAFRIPMTDASGHIDETILPNSIKTKIVRFRAGEPISGGVPVVLLNQMLYRAKGNNVEHFQKVIGLSKHAGEENEMIEVIKEGVADANVMPNFVYFLAENGGLTTASPENGIFQIIGFGIEIGKIFVNLSTAIWR